MKSEEEKAKSALKLAGMIIGGTLLLIVGFMSWTTVPVGHRGVLTTFGKPTYGVINEGFVIQWPIGQTVNLMEVRTDKMEIESGAASKDLQLVHTKIAVNFRVIPEEADKLFIEVGPSYKDRIINPAVQETFKAATAQFTAEELIAHREKLTEIIKSMLGDKLLKNHMMVENVNIMNFDFSPQFNHAIEEKQIAEQDSLKAKYQLSQKKTEVEQAVAIAEANKRATIENATGQAESIRLTAIAQAEATKIRAVAESEALRIISQTATEKSLMLRAIERWDGVMPKVTGKEFTPLINIENKEK